MREKTLLHIWLKYLWQKLLEKKKKRFHLPSMRWLYICFRNLWLTNLSEGAGFPACGLWMSHIRVRRKHDEKCHNNHLWFRLIVEDRTKLLLCRIDSRRIILLGIHVWLKNPARADGIVDYYCPGQRAGTNVEIHLLSFIVLVNFSCQSTFKHKIFNLLQNLLELHFDRVNGWKLYKNERT